MCLAMPTADDHAMRRPSHDPYCAFKNDKQRLRALISRDLRYAAIACAVIAGNVYVPWGTLARWLGLAG